MQRTLAQTIYDRFKPKNLTFEKYRQFLIDSGLYDEEYLDTLAEEKVEDRRRKVTPSITPRVANWTGHEEIRYMIKSDAKMPDIIKFLAIVLYERMQKVGGGVNAELVEKWRNTVDPLLDELHVDEAVKVSLEWFKKAISLGEINSKAMKAYLNSKNKSSKPEEVEDTQKTDSYFPEDEEV